MLPTTPCSINLLQSLGLSVKETGFVTNAYQTVRHQPELYQLAAIVVKMNAVDLEQSARERTRCFGFILFTWPNLLHS